MKENIINDAAVKCKLLVILKYFKLCVFVLHFMEICH